MEGNVIRIYCMAYTTCVQEMKGWENSPHGSFSAHTPNINPFAENKTKKKSTSKLPV